MFIILFCAFLQINEICWYYLNSKLTFISATSEFLLMLNVYYFHIVTIDMLSYLIEGISSHTVHVQMFLFDVLLMSCHLCTT